MDAAYLPHNLKLYVGKGQENDDVPTLQVHIILYIRPNYNLPEHYTLSSSKTSKILYNLLARCVDFFARKCI